MHLDRRAQGLDHRRIELTTGLADQGLQCSGEGQGGVLYRATKIEGACPVSEAQEAEVDDTIAQGAVGGCDL